MVEQTADEALLRFLTKHGTIEAWVIEAAEEYRRAHAGTIIEALCDGGFLDESAVVDLFQQQLRLPRVDLSEAPALPRAIDPEVLRQHLVMPAAVNDGRLLLAMANPLDYEAIKVCRFASGLRILPAIAPLSELRAALPCREAAPPPGTATTTAGDRMAASAPQGEAVAPAEAPPVETSNSPIIKMAALLVEQGIGLGASDIHLEPTMEGLTLRYRIDGVLEEATRLSASVRNPLIARLKVMAKLDIAERRVPQDGGTTLFIDGRRIDCRVSTLPTQYGEKVVIRLLDATKALVQLDQLGFEPGELARVQESLGNSEGVILTTGPTGSGKSTTLYAMLQAIHSPEVNIVTVENPIEYRLPGINQTEVNERQGMTFAAALRSISRQDPDVILIGEIRDRETAEIAIQAAQTGHLVLSTLHTNDSVGAITRLAKLGIEREMIASGLLMVIAQRLVRRVCGKCGVAVSPDEWNHLAFRKALGDHPVQRGPGCGECRNSGYRGRVGVYEILRTTLELKRLITTGASETEMRDLMRRQGGRSLMQVALEKIRLGRTTPDEVAAVIKSDEGMGNCPGCGAEVDERFHACPFCGNALRNDCPGCGAPLQDGWERCPGCGTLIAGEAAPRAPQQKPTLVTLVAPMALAVGSVLGAGVRGLCAAGGLDEVAAGELELAVVEACGLAVGSTDAGELRIEVEVSFEGCSVCLSAEGPPWAWPRPSAKPPDLEAFSEDTAAPEVRAFLIRSSVDEASYERVDRTNRLWLIKRPAPMASGATTSPMEGSHAHH